MGWVYVLGTNIKNVINTAKSKHLNMFGYINPTAYKKVSNSKFEALCAWFPLECTHRFSLAAFPHLSAAFVLSSFTLGSISSREHRTVISWQLAMTYEKSVVSNAFSSFRWKSTKWNFKLMFFDKYLMIHEHEFYRIGFHMSFHIRMVTEIFGHGTSFIGSH